MRAFVSALARPQVEAGTSSYLRLTFRISVICTPLPESDEWPGFTWNKEMVRDQQWKHLRGEPVPGGVHPAGDLLSTPLGRGTATDAPVWSRVWFVSWRCFTWNTERQDHFSCLRWAMSVLSSS